MADFIEALRAQAMSNQLLPPIDPTQEEAERQLAETKRVAEEEAIRQNLETITAAKISCHQEWLDEYHLFSGTDPAEIFSGDEVDLIANFLNAMRTAGLPGAKALVSEEKRLQVTERRWFGLTRNKIFEEARSVPAPSGYLLGARVLGGVQFGRNGMSSVVTANYRHDNSAIDLDPTNTKKVYLCTDGLLREVDERVAVSKDAYLLGQWVVTKAVNDVPKDTTTLDKQHADHMKINGSEGHYSRPLVIGDGQVFAWSNKVLTDPGGRDGYDYISPTYIYKSGSYLCHEGGLYTRLQRIIKQLPPESINLPPANSQVS